MRMSEWSSDVCASDLLAGGAADALPKVGGPILLLSGSCSAATNAQVARWEADGGPTLRLDPLALAEGTQSAEKTIEWLGATGGDPALEIGRAQCRERVRQYGWIEVGAATLKKK